MTRLRWSALSSLILRFFAMASLRPGLRLLGAPGRGMAPLPPPPPLRRVAAFAPRALAQPRGRFGAPASSAPAASHGPSSSPAPLPPRASLSTSPPPRRGSLASAALGEAGASGSSGEAGGAAGASAPPSFLTRLLKPLRDFGFGASSFWEGGVGLFVIAGMSE